MTLSELKPGESARIVSVDAAGVVRQRLADFGLRSGEEITVIRLAPLADPIEFKIRDGYISLRRTEADLIAVSRIG